VGTVLTHVKNARGEMVAIHPRDTTPGGYSTIMDHLCSHHQHYLKRSPEYYIQRAEKISPHLAHVIKCLFDGGRPPEQNYRTCDGFFSIYRKVTPEIFNAACQMAIDHRCYSYKYILKLVDKLQKEGIPEVKPEVPLPDHKNIRGPQYYKQLTLKI
jgi:hypothetical protein